MECYLHIDIRPRLQVANFYILDVDPSKKFTIDVHESSVNVTTICNDGDISSTQNISCVNIKFCPNSCSNLQLLPNGICFRLQVKPMNDDVEPSINGVIIKPSTSYTATCNFCRSLILYENISFERVLPLPSEEAISECGNWFCCQHADPIDSVARFYPKSKDCFLSDNYVCVNSRVVDLTCVKVNQKSQVFCKRCGSTIGKFIPVSNDDSSAFNFHNHAIVFTPENSSILNTEDHLKQVLALKLLKCLDNMNNKVCITSNKNNVSLFLWLTDKGILHLSAHLTGTNKNVTCTPRPVIKVLYRIENSTSSLSCQWQNDPTVEFMQVIPEYLSKIMDLLVQSTKTLHQPLKKIDLFWIAYIRLDV